MTTSFEDRQNEVDTAHKMARDLHECLAADDELFDAAKAAKEIAGDLDSAECCEVVRDFDICINSAHAGAMALKVTLKAAKVKAKADDLPETVEVIEEAMAEIKVLLSELDELLPEDA